MYNVSKDSDSYWIQNHIPKLTKQKKKIQQHQKAKRKHPDVGNSTNFKVNMNNA